MSKLISGKEAMIALANGEDVEVKFNYAEAWHLINRTDAYAFSIFLDERGSKFRLKPRTVNLNGVEVGQLYSSQWGREKPNKVTLEFKTEDEARYFNNNALKIFNGV